MSLVAEAPGFIQVFSDGTVKRFAPETASPSEEWSTGANRFKSKDVIIDPSKPITGRIFSPHVSSDSEPSPAKLPILIYFHGGGFCIGSTAWLGYHVFLGNLSAVAKAMVLSVDYRLAPEHKLPIAYEDCYGAIEWLLLHQSKESSDPWLQNADLSRVFLCGDSAGGNIAHHVALKCVASEIRDVTIKGLVLIHPFFGSEARTELERIDTSAHEVAMNDMFWKLSLPEGSGRDFYGCNFEKGGDVAWDSFPSVLVFVAGLDFLKERGAMYAEFLQEKGVVKVELFEAEEESHVYHVWNPQSEATRLLQKRIGGFMYDLNLHGCCSQAERSVMP